MQLPAANVLIECFRGHKNARKKPVIHGDCQGFRGSSKLGQELFEVLLIEDELNLLVIGRGDQNHVAALGCLEGSALLLAQLGALDRQQMGFRQSARGHDGLPVQILRTACTLRVYNRGCRWSICPKKNCHSSCGTLRATRHSRERRNCRKAWSASG